MKKSITIISVCLIIAMIIPAAASASPTDSLAAEPDDGVLDVAFFGDSYTSAPKVHRHFAALCEGKHSVRIHNNTKSGYTLFNHYEEWSRLSLKPAYQEKIDSWDVVILNQMIMGYAFGANLLTDLFGPDKEYYNLNNFRIMKSEVGEGMTVNGTVRNYVFERNGELDYRERDSNEGIFRMRDRALEQNGLRYICLNIPTHASYTESVIPALNYEFDPDVLIDQEDFIGPDGNTPSSLYGYCMALALYCTMFGEPCADQNLGVLKDEDIPGDTAAQKEEYILTVKEWIQDQLDFQGIVTSSFPAPVRIPGDINRDGEVNSKDLTRLLKFFAGDASGVRKSVFDINGDGYADTRDLIRLMKHLSGFEAKIF